MKAPFIVAWTLEIPFDWSSDKTERIETFTEVDEYFKCEDETKGGYHFKLKGDSRVLWVYYDTFIVKNTPKNVKLIQEAQDILEQQRKLHRRSEEIFKGFEAERPK